MQLGVPRLINFWSVVWRLLPSLGLPLFMCFPAQANFSCEDVFSSANQRQHLFLEQIRPLENHLGSIPAIVLVRDEQDLYLDEYGPTSANGPEFNIVKQMIGFAGDGMNDQRGWGQAFNDYRRQAAIKYAAQSWYADLWFKPWDGDSGERRGTLGLTLARSETSLSRAEEIPMQDIVDEENGNSWKTPLADIQKKIGQIYEARTYRLLDTDINQKMTARSLTMTWIYEKIKTLTATNPEIRQEPVVFTYGDATSVRMYRRLGFELLGPQQGFPPLKKWGRTWYALRISPNKLAEDHKNFQNDHLIYPDKPAVLDTASGNKIQITGPLFYIKNRLSSFRVLNRTNIAPGVFIPAGSLVRVASNGDIEFESVEGETIGSSAAIDGIEIQAKQTVRFSQDGYLKSIGGLNRETYFSDAKIKLPASSVVIFGERGQLIMGQFASQSQLLPNLTIPANTRFRIHYTENGLKIDFIKTVRQQTQLPSFLGGPQFTLKPHQGFSVTFFKNRQSPAVEDLQLTKETLQTFGFHTE